MTRKGMSMAEVLVALFLLALGTLAILTMFPLGMYHMSLALKDDRTAQSAQQADAYMRTIWRTRMVEQGGAGEPELYNAFSYPDANPVTLGFQRGTPVVTTGPSYPVFVDPMGWFAPWSTLNSAPHQYWVGGAGSSPFLPRRSLNLLTSQTAAASHRACSIMDGLGFAENGTASTSGGSVERELRYNWMWILQRPDNTVPNTASMTVVVFDKRSFLFAPQGAESVYASNNAPSPLSNIVMQPLLTTIQLPVAYFGVPPVQKGGWIMDATPGLRHAIFYRVVSVTDNPTNIVAGIPVPTTDIELQTPIRRLDGSTNAYNGTLMYFAGVSEVFDRPNLTPYDF